jgi:hypothetical protein
MGVIGSLLGIGKSADKIGTAVERVAEIFVPNRTKIAENNNRRSLASLDQLSSEFTHAPSDKFNRFISGLNRLPRPVLALGTVGLFVYAMADPIGFALRMRGLDTVPDPLWWLLGAIVSFYFGARELHYKRREKVNFVSSPLAFNSAPMPEVLQNKALSEWQRITKHV